MADSVITAVLCVAVALRALVARFPFSGKDAPPMFGDFEAQRHWMAIALHIPVDKWYTHNTGFWDIDYPPLTAYVSGFFGLFARAANPNWVSLKKEFRGIDTPGVTTFMRLTVLACDFAVFFPAVLLFTKFFVAEQSRLSARAVFSVLCFPGFLLIDHAHFQYNNVMLGLWIFAAYASATKRYTMAAATFVSALMFKQMALYYAIPIFTFLLRDCMMFSEANGNPFRIFATLANTVIMTFSALLWPVRYQLKQVFNRVFAIQRGIFEDKVASVWCAADPVLKVRRYAIPVLFKIAAGTTLLANLPAALGAMVKRYEMSLEATARRARVLAWATLSCSMAFFLFSFQVHEKSILLPATPALLLLADAIQNYDAYTAKLLLSVLLWATFSLFPLINREGSAPAYFGTLLVWLFAAVSSFGNKNYNGERHKTEKKAKGKGKAKIAGTKNSVPDFALYTTVASISIWHTLEFIVTPPPRYPHIGVLANCAMSCAAFILCWVWATWRTWTA